MEERMAWTEATRGRRGAPSPERRASKGPARSGGEGASSSASQSPRWPLLSHQTCTGAKPAMIPQRPVQEGYDRRRRGAVRDGRVRGLAYGRPGVLRGTEVLNGAGGAKIEWP